MAILYGVEESLQVLFLRFIFFFITAGFQMAVNDGMSRDAVNGKKTRILRYGDARYF